MASWTVYVDGVAIFAGYPDTDEETLDQVQQWVRSMGGRVLYRLPGHTLDWDKNDPTTVAIATANYAQFKYGTSAQVTLKMDGVPLPKSERKLKGDVF